MLEKLKMINLMEKVKGLGVIKLQNMKDNSNGKKMGMEN